MWTERITGASNQVLRACDTRGVVVDIAAAAHEQRSVHKGGPEDVASMAAALGAAFEDDPAAAWVVPDDARRKQLLTEAFALFLERIWLEQDECYTTEKGVGAAVWELPDQWKLGLVDQLKLLPRLAMTYRRWTPRLGRTLTALESDHPAESHYYLPFVGVVPEWQGRGLGAALLKPVLDRCDSEGMPAYLEASSPRNRTLYERQGFAVTEEFRLGRGSPPLWRMWRDPAPGSQPI
jgi:GNAT superfamily N-acetyltransferase